MKGMIIKENKRMKNLYYGIKIRDNVANTLKGEKLESKETTYTNHIPKIWSRNVGLN